MKKVIYVLAVLAISVPLLRCGEEEEKPPFTPRAFEVWAVQMRYEGFGQVSYLAKFKPNGSLMSSVKLGERVSDITYLKGKVYGLWHPEPGATHVYEIDPNNGSVTNYIDLTSTLGSSSRGIGSSGKNLIILNPEGKKIYKLTTAGSIISSVPAITRHVTGLDCYGPHLWYFENEEKKIITAKDSNGDVVDQCLYLKGLYGLGYDGQYLWGYINPEDEESAIRRVNPTTGDTMTEFPVPGGDDDFISGLTVYFKG